MRKTVGLFYMAVKDEMERLSIDYELVFVDDGSKDRTADTIIQLHRLMIESLRSFFP